MTESGKEITQAIKGFRAFHKQVALLLTTATDELQQCGWETVASIATADTSALLGYAEWWMPHYAFRFLTNPGHPGKMAFITVILDHIEDPDAVEEPIVSAGWMKFDKDKPTKDDIYYWYAKIHLWVDGRKDNGTWTTATPDSLPSDLGTMPFREFNSFAIPLMDAQTSDDLVQKIVQPLLDGIGKPDRKTAQPGAGEEKP